MDKSGEDLSKMIETLMADERFGEVLAAVKSSFSTDAENGSASAEDPVSPVQTVATPSDENSEDARSTPASSAPANPMLSPELISKLPQIMSMLSSGDGKSGAGKMADRKRLLQALKPFLSDRRRDAVDSIVNIAGIADLFGI